LNSTHQPTRIEIPRIRGFAPETFEKNYRQPIQPVIMNQVVSDWPAFDKWSPQYFRDTFADQQIQACLSLSASEVPYFSTDKQHRRSLAMKEFIDIMQSDQTCYLDQSDIKAFQAISHDYQLNTLMPTGSNFTSLWIGNNTRSGLHYDNMDNFFIQIYGEKRVTLLAPDAAKYVYPFGDNISKSQVDPEQADLKKYPRFAKATLLVSQLTPGDVLFLPRGWWHHFSSLGTSISISCWHGQSLTIAEQVRGVNLAGKHLWLRILRDFIWHGLCKRRYQQRLFSSPPTGKILYDLIFHPNRLAKPD